MRGNKIPKMILIVAALFCLMLLSACGGTPSAVRNEGTNPNPGGTSAVADNEGTNPSSTGTPTLQQRNDAIPPELYTLFLSYESARTEEAMEEIFFQIIEQLEVVLEDGGFDMLAGFDDPYTEDLGIEILGFLLHEHIDIFLAMFNVRPFQNSRLDAFRPNFDFDNYTVFDLALLYGHTGNAHRDRAILVYLAQNRFDLFINLFSVAVSAPLTERSEITEPEPRVNLEAFVGVESRINEPVEDLSGAPGAGIDLASTHGCFDEAMERYKQENRDYAGSIYYGVSATRRAAEREAREAAEREAEAAQESGE
jgi:hypothetical protein